MKRRRARPAAGWRAAVAASLAPVLGAACADGSGSVAWTTDVDTVGGVIRVTHTTGSDVAPTLRADEELRVGTVAGEGPQSFGLIRSIAVLDDGRFAVGDAQAEEVRLFDAEGRHLRTFGGAGQGPGELSGMQGVFLDHDGLLRVAERQNARLSVFHPDSRFVTSFPLQLFSYGGRGPWDAAIDSTGRTVVVSSGQYGEGRYWNMLRFYDPAMQQLDSVPYEEYTSSIRETEDRPAQWQVPVGRGTLYLQVPFYAVPRQAVAPTGELWTTAEGLTRLEVSRWTPPGDTSLVIVVERPTQPVTSSERDSAMAEVYTRLEGRVATPPTLDPSKIPAHKPPAYGLSLDERGRLWVRTSDPGSGSTIYDIFEPDGRHAGTLELPFRVDAWIPPTSRGDAVWAVVTDDADVQYVVRARVRSAGSAEGG